MGTVCCNSFTNYVKKYGPTSNGLVPNDWSKSVFVPVPTKETKICAENTRNRTITLISHCSKIQLKIIANRMKSKLNEKLDVNQAGFRPGRGTCNQILNVKMIIEKNRSLITISSFPISIMRKKLTWSITQLF